MTAADRWPAYTESVVYFAAPDGTVRVGWAPAGHQAGTFPGRAGYALYVVTAFNPGGAFRDPSENGRAQVALEDELRRAGLKCWRAAGGDPAWSHVEPSVAVIGIDRAAALAIGRRYGQEAIFELTSRHRTILSCRDGKKSTTGWRIDQLCTDHPEAGRAHTGRQLAVGAHIANPLAGTGMSGPSPVGAACDRCPRPYHPNVADAAYWNMVLRDGRIVAVLCPGCQSPEEDMEAEVNQATLSYEADDQGRIWNRPRTAGSEPAS